MEIKDLGEVKTTIRIKQGVKQVIRLFTKTQRQLIKEAVEGRPDHLTIEDVLNMYDVSPSVYYNWMRNDKEENDEIDENIPNPLLETSMAKNFLSANQLQEFYSKNSEEIIAFIEKKYKDWADKDIIAQIAERITDQNIKEVAKAGNISVNDLKSFLLRENMNLSYFTVESIKKHLKI